MAIIGHFLAAFLAGHFVPQANVVFLCKLTMMSDAVCALFMLLGLEKGALYPAWLMSTPPPGTQRLVKKWISEGHWEEGVDLEPGEEGFRGFGALYPFYCSISYSHSVELMAILAVVIIAYLVVRRRIDAKYAAAIFFCMVSHPLTDMIFHDAHFFMGDRASSRFNLGLWQINSIGPLVFLLEVAMAYFPMRLWLSGRVPISDDPKIEADIAANKKQFWTLCLAHNMTSWYILGPLMEWGFYKYTSFPFGDDNFVSYMMSSILMWSWTVALYPLYKMDCLLVSKEAGANELSLSAPAAPAEKSQYLQVDKV